MPWQNQNGGGPWGQGPRGQGPRGGGPQGPDLDELIRRGQERLRGLFSTGGGGARGIILLIILALAVWMGSGFYRVQPSERAVVLRFGKWQETTVPGLRYHLPWPIETVTKTNVLAERQENIGFVQGSNGKRDILDQSLMLTGDENIVDINFTVIWDIKDVTAYQFKIEAPQLTVRAMAESAMREEIGKSKFQDVTTEGRSRVEADVKALLQQTLDSYDSGIRVKRLQLLKSDPPTAVIDAFRDVQRARADMDRVVNEAQAYQNDIIPRARGQAAQILQEAEGYKRQVVARAEGEAKRFISVYDQYAKAKDVTRTRLYLETMEAVLSRTNKVIIDQQGPGVVPYLPLPEINKRQKGGK
jgi:membrane protease subunit HflK